ncbi:MAG: hypothetical protein CMJ32_05005 [Phycisphaerae bacterium]|nr:hypothetical protein [Phycisphaerae bacterium]
MGIYDREYYKQQPGRPTMMPRRSGVGWSVNTWLIVLCCAVFVINGFLPKSYIHVETDYQGEWKQKEFQLDSDRLTKLPVQAEGNMLVQPVILDKDPTQVVAVNYYSRVPILFKWMYFSTSRALFYYSPSYGAVGFEFWRFIGFQFLHANLMHLLFNMIGLYFFGSMIEQYLGSKRYLAFYLLCGICGALMYLLLNAAGYASTIVLGGVDIPGLLFNNPNVPLIGASAGVFGVLMAGAFIAPRTKVLLFFIIPMPLSWLAYGLVGVALLTVLVGGEGSNAGGEAAHLGGAIAGFYFIRRPHHLHGFFDLMGRVDPTSRSNKARKARRNSDPGTQAKVDRILDKISRQGLQSLSEKEKRILKEASRT